MSNRYGSDDGDVVGCFIIVAIIVGAIIGVITAIGATS